MGQYDVEKIYQGTAPKGVTYDNTGIWFTDGTQMYSMNATGDFDARLYVTPTLTTMPFSFTQPMGLATDGNGQFFVADQGVIRIVQR
jgi:hypothetical protein